MAQKNILIADDEKDYCRHLRDYLTRQGHCVDIAYDGKEASDLLKAKSYDFIFFDCNMPEFSGVELAKIIKENNPRAKKIMVSGYDLISEEFSSNLGVDMFLSKPVSLEKIKDIIEK